MNSQNIIKIASIVGARPNFIKLAPVSSAIEEHNKNSNNKIKEVIIHTAQHYDDNISKIFFKELNIPKPHYNLGVGSGPHGWQTGEMLKRIEKVLIKEKPDILLAYGDTNSTLAGALAAVKLYIPVAHVEAGLRSFDREMPEEINRILTDAISDYLFITEESANKNLRREGILKEKIFFVGNVMIDTLKKFKIKSEKLKTSEKLGLKKHEYALLTMHRPSNVDDKDSFKRILNALREISKRIHVYFPAHPRTKKQIELFDLQNYLADSNIMLAEPVGYLDFLNLMINSKFVLTDSGGIQEETTVLNIPCLTLRKNTERPVTVTQGTNTIVDNDTDKIIEEANTIIDGRYKQGKTPKFWDGKAAQRIIKILMERL